MVSQNLTSNYESPPSETWACIDMQDMIDGNKSISQNGNRIFTLTVGAKGRWKSLVSSKLEATLVSADGNARIGTVLFPDHVLSKNDVEINLEQSSVVPAATTVMLCRNGSLSSKHSFSVQLPGWYQKSFTWSKPQSKDSKNLGKGTLNLKDESGNQVAAFQPMSKGALAGRFFISPGLPEMLLPVIVLTCVGLCAKAARDKADEQFFSGIIENTVGAVAGV